MDRLCAAHRCSALLCPARTAGLVTRAQSGRGARRCSGAVGGFATANCRVRLRVRTACASCLLGVCACVYCLLLINNAGPKQYSPPPVPSPNHGIGAPPSFHAARIPPNRAMAANEANLSILMPASWGCVMFNRGLSSVSSQFAGGPLAPANSQHAAHTRFAWLSASHHAC